MKNMNLIYLVLVMALALSGCWSTIRNEHPLMQPDQSAPYARVYFIRPDTERMMGLADNRITISLDQQVLLQLVKGEYTVVQLQPGQRWVSIDSDTSWGPVHKVKAVSRTYSFNFSAGETYYIALRPIDGEFRGVHFIANAITLAEAQGMTRHLRPAGPARSHKLGQNSTK